MSRHTVLSPAEISRQIAQGDPVVIYEGYALHLGEWINRHPGGKLAILHMVGRDATDEINMYVMRERPSLYVPKVQPCHLWESRGHTMSPEGCGRGWVSTYF
jgi:cytochrome b involved in lipid metabolism